jgi:nucleotide-binding universal stress UspA family protein
LEPSLKIVFSSDLKNQMEAQIRRDIENIQASVGLGKITICIEEGDVAPSVCSYASSVGADLLVIGRRGRVNEFGYLREDAYSIIREAACPVLSV